MFSPLTIPLSLSLPSTADCRTLLEPSALDGLAKEARHVESRTLYSDQVEILYSKSLLLFTRARIYAQVREIRELRQFSRMPFTQTIGRIQRALG
jgi:hypothetical protein